MKTQLELTVRLPHSLEETEQILIKNGFQLKEISYLEDIYMKKNKTYSTIKDLLNECILIRKEGSYFKGFVLKKKEYKQNGDIIKDQKTYLEIIDLEKGKQFLEQIDYQFFFTLKQHLYIYEKENTTLMIQKVENLGLFLEYEALNGETEEELKTFLEHLFQMKFSNYYEKKAIQYIEKYQLY